MKPAGGDDVHAAAPVASPKKKKGKMNMSPDSQETATRSGSIPLRTRLARRWGQRLVAIPLRTAAEIMGEPAEECQAKMAADPGRFKSMTLEDLVPELCVVHARSRFVSKGVAAQAMQIRIRHGAK